MNDMINKWVGTSHRFCYKSVEIKDRGFHRSYMVTNQLHREMEKFRRISILTTMGGSGGRNGRYNSLAWPF
jgi:hypothetical protein